MKTVLLAVIAIGMLGYQIQARAQTVVTPTPPAVIYVPSGTPDIAKQEANKQLVLDWLHDFWQGGDFNAWPKYMTADFRNHDPREPAVGAQALVDWLRARMAASKRPMKLPQPDHPHMFLMADGDLVFVGGDPSTSKNGYDYSMNFSNIAGNIIRIQNGKIAEWWYVGTVPKQNVQGPRPGEPGYVAPRAQ